MYNGLLRQIWFSWRCRQAALRIHEYSLRLLLASRLLRLGDGNAERWWLKTQEREREIHVGRATRKDMHSHVSQISTTTTTTQSRLIDKHFILGDSLSTTTTTTSQSRQTAADGVHRMARPR